MSRSVRLVLDQSRCGHDRSADERRCLVIPVRQHPRRRRLALVATAQGVEVRAPENCPFGRIEAFVQAQRAWIERAVAEQARRQLYLWGCPHPGLTRDQAQAELSLWLAARLPHWQARMGVEARQVRIRALRSRWGSCSARGDVTFALSLVQVPQAVADYVVVHELAHRREMNHSPAFWSHVAAVLPDFERRRADLRRWGRKIAQI